MPRLAAMAVPVVLDCDPGHDDVLAIVAAARHTELLGITTVAGNAPLDRTTYNALVIRDLLGIDVPVHSGAERPLVAESKSAPAVHGASGLDGAPLPPPTRPVDSPDAVSFIVEACRQREGAWIVATGPLTNVALALRAAPDLANRISGVSVMGGGSFGNRTAAAEFNLWADPEAAAMVFSASPFPAGPLVMAGLDVTHQFTANPARIEAVVSIGGLLAATLADLLRFFYGTYVERTDRDAIDGAPMHDVLAVLALTHPELFHRDTRHVVVETTGTHTRGMTLIDERRLIERPAPNVDVLRSVDSDAAFDVLLAAIASFSGA